MSSSITCLNLSADLLVFRARFSSSFTPSSSVDFSSTLFSLSDSSTLSPLSDVWPSGHVTETRGLSFLVFCGLGLGDGLFSFHWALSIAACSAYSGGTGDGLRERGMSKFDDFLKYPDWNINTLIYDIFISWNGVCKADTNPSAPPKKPHQQAHDQPKNRNKNKQTNKNKTKQNRNRNKSTNNKLTNKQHKHYSCPYCCIFETHHPDRDPNTHHITLHQITQKLGNVMRLFPSAMYYQNLHPSTYRRHRNFRFLKKFFDPWIPVYFQR